MEDFNAAFETSYDAPAPADASPIANESGPTADAPDANASQPEGAPDRYEFKIPEGQTYDSAVIEAFEASARNSNVSQSQAQRILDEVTPVLAQRQAAQVAAVQKGWLEAARADREFGGDRLTQNLAYAHKAMDKYATPELRSFLEETHLSNHPEIVRLMVRVGRQMDLDNRAAASGGDSEWARHQRTLEEMYPSTAATTKEQKRVEERIRAANEPRERYLKKTFFPNTR